MSDPSVVVAPQQFTVTVVPGGVTVVSAAPQGPPGPPGAPGTGGSGGTTDHALLTHLDYASAAHTGFTPASRQVLSGAGLSGGGGLSADITLSLTDTAVVPGVYTNAGITVDQQGRITAAASGTAGGVTSFNTRAGAVTLTPADVTGALTYTPVAPSRSLSAGTGLSGGGDLSADRTLSLADTAVTPGSYTNAAVTVDQQGRVTAAASGSGGGVTSFNTRTGAVVLFAADLPADVAFTDAANVFVGGQVVGNTTSAVTTVPLTINAPAGQTADLLQVGKNNNPGYFRLDSAGNISVIGGSTARIQTSSSKPYFPDGLTFNSVASPALGTALLNSAGGAYPWVFVSGATTSRGLIVKAIASQSVNTFEVTDSSFNVLFAVNIAGTCGLFVPAAAAVKGLTVKGAAAQSGNLQEWQDSSSNPLCTISENGYFTTRKKTVPADTELANSEVALWLDDTAGATKLMVKAKDSAGTVRTAAIALA